jgi:ankyrin repeat protein
VFCQLEILRDCFPPSVRRILKELPDSLDETYERILKEIRKPNRRHAHQLLQCLVAAVRPLRVEELAEVLAFDFDVEGIPKLNLSWRCWEDQETAVMLACSSLVIIVNDGDSRIVQFSHFSVKEFLTASRLAEPIRDVSRYHIRLVSAHTILAQACIGALLRVDDRVDRNSIKDFPLARYAAQYWDTHARFENASSRITDGMECLFDADKPHFATWLWIYNEDYSNSNGNSMSTMRPEKPETVPLYYAAMLGFRDLAEYLIAEHPEDVNARGKRKVTPMHVAAKAGHADILALLLDHGADLEGRGVHNSTPLHHASWMGKLEAGQYLLDRGADTEAQDTNDWTPLVLAVIYGHVEFARMLLERGARTDARDNRGWTPLHRVIMVRKIQFVRLLLEYGADVNARDNRGKTPSQLASSSCLHEVVQLLSEYGADSVSDMDSVCSIDSTNTG